MGDRPRLEALVDTDVRLGEGPVWDQQLGILWWVDIVPGILHRYDPQSSSDRSVQVGHHLSAVALREGGLVAAVDYGFASLDPSTGALEPIAPVEQGEETRMNDGACDADGNFWAGSMDSAGVEWKGALYRLRPDGHVDTVLSQLGISNGLAWSSDGQTMYYVDSLRGSVDSFDFAEGNLDVSSRRPVIEIPSNEGLPDGITIDAEDHIWVAVHGAGAVRRYSPQGSLSEVVEVGTPKTTSCEFGGPDLGDLYITAASHEKGGELVSGGLYRTRPGVTGRASGRFAG